MGWFNKGMKAPGSTPNDKRSWPVAGAQAQQEDGL